MKDDDNGDSLIAVDWGTSNFRAWLLAANGRVLDRVQAPCGVAQIEPGGFAASLRAQLGHWLGGNPQPPVLMAGMVGSANGWCEVPYLACPVAMPAIADHVVCVAGRDDASDVHIVPGLDICTPAGHYDVMRGEEVQVIGALAGQAAVPSRLFCVPGTHSKWVEVRGQQICGFSTSMTGDTYRALREHSFLARSMGESQSDSAAFTRGLARASSPGGLLQHLFSVRTVVLHGDLASSAAASYLSGILIGSEVSTMLAAHAHTGVITLIGGRQLAPLYADAVRFYGREVNCIDGEQAAYTGLHQLATYMEMI